MNGHGEVCVKIRRLHFPAVGISRERSPSQAAKAQGNQDQATCCRSQAYVQPINTPSLSTVLELRLSKRNKQNFKSRNANGNERRQPSAVNHSGRLQFQSIRDVLGFRHFQKQIGLSLYARNHLPQSKCFKSEASLADASRSQKNSGGTGACVPCPAGAVPNFLKADPWVGLRLNKDDFSC